MSCIQCGKSEKEIKGVMVTLEEGEICPKCMVEWNEEKFNEAIKTDGVWPKGLEIMCLYALRLNYNPLQAIRDWLKVNEIEMRVDYYSDPHKVNKTKILQWTKGKKLPMIVVASQTINGFHNFVKIYLVRAGYHECTHTKVLTSEFWERKSNEQA